MGNVGLAGARWVVFGVLSAMAPVAYCFIARAQGMMTVKCFAGLFVLGVYGLYKFFDGLAMVLKPRAFKVHLSNLND